MKSMLLVTQGHWKWHHWIDRIRVPIHLRYKYVSIFYRYHQRRILAWL